VIAAIGLRAHAIAIDRPGWNGRGSPADLAGNARAALAALAGERASRAIVVGHSLGAAVAAWLAAEHPEHVASLVLVAPSATRASLNRFDQLLATPLLGPVISTAALVGAGAALQAEPLRKRVSASLALDGDYLKTAGAALLRPATWRVFAFEQQMLIRDLPALEQRLAAISSPTTVVSGTADRVVTPSSARRLAAQIRAADLVRVSGATHLLPQQHPGELAEIIVRARWG
jgi:pimeloyl-ACP methyl ester carboxylesterase